MEDPSGPNVASVSFTYDDDHKLPEDGGAS
jgi:hypothetical protein